MGAVLCYAEKDGIQIAVLCVTGIDDFPYVNETHIKAALPFLKSAGVPYYVHAELKPPDDSPVSQSISLPVFLRSPTRFFSAASK